MDGMPEAAGHLWKYMSRPFKWWLRKDKQSDYLSYGMSIEAIPNPQGWVTGAIASFYVECDITGNNTEFERIINLPDNEIIYTKAIFDDEDLKAELAERIQKYINIPLEGAYARKVINMQVMIEGLAVWGGLFAVILGFIAVILAGI